MNKLIRLLLSFNTKERARFKDYLNSPFFNNNNDLVKLDLLIDPKKFPSSKEKQEQYKENLIRKFYPEKYPTTKKDICPTDLTGLRRMVSQLIKKVDGFLLQIQHEKESAENTRRKVDGYMVRKLYKEAREISIKENKLGQGAKFNRQYFWDSYRNQEAIFYLNVIEKNKADVGKVVTPFLKFYYSTMLLYACATLDQSKIRNTTYDISFIQEVDQNLGLKIDQMPVVIKIYYYILQLLKGVDEDINFKKIKEMLFRDKEQLHPTDIRQYCNFLLNFCIRRINIGHYDYKLERFNLYQEFLPTGIWYDEVHLRPLIYYLSVRSALAVGELEIALETITKYKEYLPKDYKKEISQLCLAEHSYALKDYRGAQSKLLSKLSKRDHFFFVVHRHILEVKILIDSDGEYEQIFGTLEALRLYLGRQKDKNINTNLVATFEQFRDYTTRLLKYNNNPNLRDKAAELLLDIQNASDLTEREWLLEKASKLLKKRW